jgi:hypothetical protein
MWNESFVATKRDLEDQLEKMDLSQLRNHANSSLAGAKRVNSAYNQERTAGSRKRWKRLQQFFMTFADFMEAYSGVIDLVRSAGQQYGEAAYQSLSILLIVGVSPVKPCTLCSQKTYCRKQGSERHPN